MIAFVLFKTFTFKSKQMKEAQVPLLKLDDSCVVHLQKAIQFETISYDDPKQMDSSEFNGFQQFLMQLDQLKRKMSMLMYHIL